jgi:hypothetical protein
MPICKRCRAIPLDGNGLPTLPDQLWGVRTTWKYIHEFYQRFSDVEPTKFPFHPNLESLTSSAKECDLCHLVFTQIERAIEELRNPDKENIRRGEIDILQKPTWELWLTRRVRGDGFYVFTSCEDSKDFCFVAAIGICVKEGKPFPKYCYLYINSIGDPLGSVYVCRPIEESPMDPKATAIVKNWVEQCNRHPTCTEEPPLLPGRIIDIGSEANLGSIKLRETEGERGRYICLSYCWGKVTHFTTTKASFATHKININYDDLSKKFKDAIAITWLLGIRYIWIDSICICQDDREDWERESAKMTSIYMNSYLTIADSAAADSSVGSLYLESLPN